MNAEIINLRRARKARARSAKEKIAGQNRALFGLPPAERERLRQDAARAQRHLDGVHLEHDASVATRNNANDDEPEG